MGRVDAFFTFLGNFWWLIFPVVGVMGGLGRAWERGARRRHERRIEVIHAKAELKSAQASARGRVSPVPLAQPTTDGAPPKPVATGSAATQLERLMQSHDAVTARWLEYELDVAKLIAYPAMSDGRQALTAAFLRAKRIADGLRPASPKARLSREQLTEYRNAVADFEVAFDVAERDARRLKDSSFTEVERKRLDTAKQLLTIAIDQAATPAERQVAYRRVRQELDGLLSISDEAIVVLEGKVALEIGTGKVQTMDAAEPAASHDPQAAPIAAPTATPRPTPPAQPVSREPVREPSPWPVPARGDDSGAGRVIRPKTQL